ncbi:hypothetical protein ABIB14_003553 [Arthrobacter sp. UYEF3]
MTITHQLVSPSTAIHCESSTFETVNAPVMNDHIHDAVLCKMFAKKDVMEPWTPSFAWETRPHPGGHHPFKSH